MFLFPSQAIRLQRCLCTVEHPLYNLPFLRLCRQAPISRHWAPPRNRHVHIHVEPQKSSEGARFPPELRSRKLPLLCSGCGAFSQSSRPGVAGYYDLNRRSIGQFLGSIPKPSPRQLRDSLDDRIVENALKSLDDGTLQELGLSPEAMINSKPEPGQDEPLMYPPYLCDRCHSLVHHHTATPIFHPSVEALADTIHDSPHRHNHIYHLVDAADFPLSVIRGLDEALEIKLKSRNRRSSFGTYLEGRKFTISFIVTRIDLVVPTINQIRLLAASFRLQLRAALGNLSPHSKLGEIYLVSAKRNWNTAALKEDIRCRGGASWMVGKANVGKSQLLHTLFPKGLVTAKPVADQQATFAQEEGQEYFLEPTILEEELPATKPLPNRPAKPAAVAPELPEHVEISLLLPPPMPLTDYPHMPIVSSLPGTTASPIRIPFGKSAGEMIDMPGLLRSKLEYHVAPEHRKSLVMTQRVVPEQLSIKTGQSLLLGGGLIRVTPRNQDVVFLAHNFTNLETHVTSTEKAIGLQAQTLQSSVRTIAVPAAATNTMIALSAELLTDVTKSRCGPLFRSRAFRDPSQLPFAVLATDLLIEGIGWVEVSAQVRKPSRRSMREVQMDGESAENPKPEKPEQATEPKRGENQNCNMPIVDVFAPEGNFVWSRQSLDGSVINRRRILPKHRRKRPRRSMKGHKKQQKLRKRLALVATANLDRAQI